MIQNSTYDLSVNERALLDIIWRKGPIARINLSTQSGLTGASVTRLTRDLMDRGLISESVNRSGFKGQPAKPLNIAPNGAYSIGVYFSHRHMEAGLVNLAGGLVNHVSKTLPDTNVETISNMSVQCIKEIMPKRKKDKEKILGIGFSLPGDFIGDGSKINAHSLFSELMHVDLHEELKSILGYEVFVENDAACVTLGEYIHGSGKRFENLLLIHIGHGIGSGIILDGKLYRGTNGNSGIIGVQYSHEGPRPSGQDLIASLAAEGIDIADFDALEDLSPEECIPLKTWVKRAAQQIVDGLNTTARILDPQVVILGGRLPVSLLQELVHEIEDIGFCNEGVMLPAPKIYASHLGPKAGIIGTACLAFSEKLFTNPSMRSGNAYVDGRK